ncbi:ABC transporter permease [Bosea caraganae]|uniref:Oligopeptide transport system permease protein OppC n=1 Tax=Bosea caraganae TaxID=2763117 RepID=A0A370KXS9_9HYPH|nr:ABC transporter permease [Bosea caraganae]RDJ19805.1 ABC transporter permease [Bosea caraganae]RDJ30056.1 ABC transporter permease [Bosea caraganae]
MTDIAAPIAPPATAPAGRKLAETGQWALIFRRFRRHRLAYFSAFVVVGIYVVALFAEFVAPFSADTYNARYTYGPPQALHFFGRDAGGELRFMYVNGYKMSFDPVALKRTFVVDEKSVNPVVFFAKGEPYNLFGLIPWDRHLIGPADPSQPMYLWGADRLGRDVLSRTIHGARISMSIGLVGVAISLFLGLLLGGMSGYYGGWIDEVVQRSIDFLKSIPTIPLWMGLAAAVPASMDPLLVYLWITVILSLVGWTDLARVVRGRFLSLRTEDFVLAARLDGCSKQRVIWRHMVPSFTSHIIASVTLAIPSMILAETALSFLGIGLKDPVVSWGVLLKDAQSILALTTAPWLLAPGAAVVVAVLALNFLGDGIRDAADPYA